MIDLHGLKNVNKYYLHFRQRDSGWWFMNKLLSSNVVVVGRHRLVGGPQVSRLGRMTSFSPETATRRDLEWIFWLKIIPHSIEPLGVRNAIIPPK